jgi:hypothetical protein
MLSRSLTPFLLLLAGILSSPSILPHPSYLANNQVQQIPPYNPPSSPVAPAAYTFGVQAFQGPSASDLSTRLEGLQQRHFQAPTTTHSRFQTSRTINGPKKRQRDGSDDEEGEEAVSRLRACGPLSEMDIEEDDSDRDYKQLDFVREEYRQRPTDHEE